MEEIIKVENLCKVYKIYTKPLDRLRSLLMKDAPGELYTAIKDISFTVWKGETVGVIGENGAGKSTLLKIISGVLTPTSGEIAVNGRVLSILELGVGLHPEFTGRENIFFYGDILSFGRDFIRSKLDEIVEFSELGDFIDKPIKTYSSGMVMRLAFSIVSSFEPDVLILDEVLAVGDMHFQKKSLNKIVSFKNNGRAILFCSHDTYSIRMVCDRTIWLKNGTITQIGDTDKVVAEYESYQLKKDEQTIALDTIAASVLIKSLKVINTNPIRTGDNIVLEVETETVKDLPYHIMVSLKLKEGRGVFVTGSHFKSGIGALKKSKKIRIIFHDVPLTGLGYYFHVRIFDENGIILYNERVSQNFDVILDETDEQILTKYICRIKNSWEIV